MCDIYKPAPAKTGSPKVAVAPDCLLNAFDDAKEALEQAEEIMETMGLEPADIQEALAHLYEARTHFHYANDCNRDGRPALPGAPGLARWWAREEMQEAPKGWYWAAFPGGWTFYRPDYGTMALFYGDTLWHRICGSKRFWGPWTQDMIPPNSPRQTAERSGASLDAVVEDSDES